jgi:hypothetical protein
MTIDKPNTLYYPETESHVLQEDYYDSELKILIPAGFTYDGASVPRFLWAVIDPLDLSEAAALVHDYLYHNAGLLVPVYVLVNDKPERCGEMVFCKRFTDICFQNIMVKWHVKKWREKAAYNAVDLFAGFAWRKHLRNNQK